MKQQEIRYRDIMAVGFVEQLQDDSAYYDKYGFHYAIITKDLTDTIYLSWEKETRLCKLVRIDNQEECNIKAELPVINLEHLKEIINFFCDAPEEPMQGMRYCTYA